MFCPSCSTSCSDLKSLSFAVIVSKSIVSLTRKTFAANTIFYSFIRGYRGSIMCYFLGWGIEIELTCNWGFFLFIRGILEEKKVGA